MRERILAILGAICLVAVALLVRSYLADDGGGASSGAKPVVACTADLMPVCQAMADDGKIQADPPILDLAGAAEPPPEIDVWITWDPAPGIANLDADLDNRNQTWGDASVLGSSTLAVASKGAAPLAGECQAGAPEWRCYFAAADDGMPIGVGRPTTAEGLARLYPIARSLLEDPEAGFQDLPSDAVQTVLESVANVPDRGPFIEQRTTLLTKPGALTFVVGPESGLRAQGGLTVAVPTPAASMAAVAVSRTGGGVDPAKLPALAESEGVQAAITRVGLAPGTGQLAPPDRAGDLFALREKLR